MLCLCKPEKKYREFNQELQRVFFNLGKKMYDTLSREQTWSTLKLPRYKLEKLKKKQAN